MKRIASLMIVGTALGLAVAAEPIKVSLLPAPVSQPPGEPATKGGVSPTSGTIPLPKLPTIPLPAPIEVAPPARPAQPMVPAATAQPVSSPKPDFNLRVPASVLNVNPSAAVPTIPVQPAPGETPMPTKQLLMTAVLGAALAASPAPAQVGTTGAPGLALKGAGEQKDDVKAELKKIAEDLKELQKSIKTLSDAVNGTKDGAVGVDAGLLKRVLTLESSFSTIDAALKRIEGKLTEQKTTSGFTPPMPMPSAKAFVRIINEYPTDMSLLVNGKSHRIKAGETKTVEVAPGSYTYELLHAVAQQPVTSSVKENETVTLRIR